MDKIHILEAINRHKGNSVHVSTKSGRFYIGRLNTAACFDDHSKLHRHLEIGWRQDRVEINQISEIHAV